jgi:hypothetical protein
MQRQVQKFGISNKRGRISTSPDPYVASGGLKEPAVCQSCQAVYRNKRWQLDPLLVNRLATSTDTHWVNCPACLKVAEHYPEGILTLRGDYLWNHEQEIRNILENAMLRVGRGKPVDRVIRMGRVEDALVVETTNTKLAEQLGRSLQKAHHGDLQIDWQEAAGVCRVQWQRWH